MDKSLKLIIESLLFAADAPLGEKDLHVWLHDATPGKIREALNELEQEYEALGRSFSLKQVAGGYQFRTRPEYADYVLLMLKAAPGRLSRAAMETLAIVAYKQPILRVEIERLRGVDVGGILKTLMEKDLVRIMGRKNLPGRPLIYGTTRKFLEVFDLKDLDSLPKLKEIRDLGADEGQPAIPAQGETENQGDPDPTGEAATADQPGPPEHAEAASPHTHPGTPGDPGGTPED
jgi:segregation and condensation protein B